VGIILITLEVIGTDGIGSCKSNYHTIESTTASDILCILVRYVNKALRLSYSAPCDININVSFIRAIINDLDVILHGFAFVYLTV
jgi:hypothetical protein